jgi:hypothetical protein
MEMEEAEEEVFFVNTLKVERSDSEEKLEAEIARMEKAIDDCFRRRAKRTRVAVNTPKNRLMSESERDCMSEKLGDGLGERTKRRRKIEEMSEKDIGNEIKKMEEIWEEEEGHRFRKSQSGLGSLLLMMAILCLIGGQAGAFTTYDCSN